MRPCFVVLRLNLKSRYIKHISSTLSTYLAEIGNAELLIDASHRMYLMSIRKIHGWWPLHKLEDRKLLLDLFQKNVICIYKFSILIIFREFRLLQLLSSGLLSLPAFALFREYTKH